MILTLFSSKLRLAVTLLVLPFSACSTNTGVIPIGKDTYYITKRSVQFLYGPPVSQKAAVYREANAFCEQHGKALETVKLDEVSQIPLRLGSASLTFRCVPR